MTKLQLLKLRWKNLLSRIRFNLQPFKYAGQRRLTLLGDWLLKHNSPILLRHTYQGALDNWRYRESNMKRINDDERKTLMELISRAKLLTLDMSMPDHGGDPYRLFISLSPQIVEQMFAYGDQETVRYFVRRLMADLESELLTINFARLPRNSRGDARLYPPGDPPASFYRIR